MISVAVVEIISEGVVSALLLQLLPLVCHAKRCVLVFLAGKF
jgi:hypothetical protein